MSSKNPPQSVKVRTGARLHFGPLSFRPKNGRHFGGLGMMVDAPGYEIEVVRTPCESGSSGDSESLARFRQTYPEIKPLLSVKEHRTAPRHRGLGSGTQRALAIGEGACLLSGINLAPASIATAMGRGTRSAIGIIGYQQGGFLVDAGHPSEDQCSENESGELAVRVEFPSEWHVLLLSPQSEQGLHGRPESQAFSELESMTEQRTNRLCRIALTEVLPALQSESIQDFSNSIHEFGSLVGEFFSGLQGGVFASSAVRDLVEQNPELRSMGVVQSSWGPTVAVFTDDHEKVDWVTNRLRRSPHVNQFEVIATQGKNVGRSIEILREDP